MNRTSLSGIAALARSPSQPSTDAATAPCAGVGIAVRCGSAGTGLRDWYPSSGSTCVGGGSRSPAGAVRCGVSGRAPPPGPAPAPARSKRSRTASRSRCQRIDRWASRSSCSRARHTSCSASTSRGWARVTPASSRTIRLRASASSCEARVSWSAASSSVSSRTRPRRAASSAAYGGRMPLDRTMTSSALPPPSALPCSPAFFTSRRCARSLRTRGVRRASVRGCRPNAAKTRRREPSSRRRARSARERRGAGSSGRLLVVVMDMCLRPCREDVGPELVEALVGGGLAGRVLAVADRDRTAPCG